MVQLVDLGFDARYHVVRVIGSTHDHDCECNVAVMILAGNAEPRHVTDRYFGDILHLDRHAIDLGKHHVLDVTYAPALSQVLVTTTIHQSDAANVHRLLADRDLATANIDVGVTERSDDLRDRYVVGVELVQIDIHIVLLG